MKKIPQKNADLRRYVFWKDARRLVLFLLWTSALIAGALSYNANHQTYPSHRLILGWKLALFVAATVLSGILIFGVWRLFARTVEGTVEASGLSRSYSASKDPGRSLHYDFQINTALRIKTDRNKIKRIRFEQKDGFYHYYHEGTRIVRLRGLPYPINLDPDAPHGYVCAACGGMAQTTEDGCPLCGYSLIDPKEL